MQNAIVEAVSRSAMHTFGKENQPMIRLLTGLGVEGDAHCGATVKHRSRVAQNPDQPNLRQVHLIHAELFDELLGEEAAVTEITGLRNPCAQLEGLAPGLMAATLSRDEQGTLIRKAGVMGIVLTGGDVRPGDPIRVELPPEPFRLLERV